MTRREEDGEKLGKGGKVNGGGMDGSGEVEGWDGRGLDVVAGSVEYLAG